MATRRRVSPIEGRAAVAAWASGDRTSGVTATAVRFALEELAAIAPGGSVEVRVPPYGAAQCIEGAHHTRGTPPNVVETDPDTWLSLVLDDLNWDEATASGRVSASGARADLAPWLPLFWPAPDQQREASPEPRPPRLIP
jgi:hypothetical protein